MDDISDAQSPILYGEAFLAEWSGTARKQEGSASQQESFKDESASVGQPVSARASPPLRRRLDTEETDVVRNFEPGSTPAPAITPQRSAKPQSEAPPPKPTPTPPHQQLVVRNALPPHVTNDDDASSVVSGLSMDEDSILVESRLMASMNVLSPIAETTKAATMPPVEVSIPTPKYTTPRRHSPPPPSSSSSTSKLDLLVANLAISNNGSFGGHSSHSSPIRKPPIASRARSEPAIMIYARTSGDSVVNSTARSTDVCPDEKLLQGRKRRHVRTVSQGTHISVGSIVGQSVAPTLSTTDSSDQSTVRRSLQSINTAENLLRKTTGADEGLACCAAAPKRNVVKQEIKHIMSVVSTPIRKIPLLKRKPADLQRSHGTLT